MEAANVFVDKNGEKRRGIQVSCEHCKKKFFTRVDQPAKCCSRECANLAKSGKRGVSCVCSQCGKEFKKRPSTLVKSKSGLFFCKRACKDAAQQLGGIPEIMPPHYGKARGRNSVSYRRLYKRYHDLDSLKCSRCSYNEFECGIDIHHIDKKKNNNKKENLIALCSPCHRALHKKLWKLGEILQHNTAT